MRTSRIPLIIAFALIILLPVSAQADPIGTAFTYQGQLIDNNQPANGTYNFRFYLYDAASGGNQIGNYCDVTGVDVTDGYFTVELNFGSVFDGNDRWLEIGVQPGEQNDPCAYTFLSPRQKLTATPYALYAKTAGSGGEGTVPGPSELRCFKQEAFSAPDGKWTTICNLSDGPALVTHFWFATYSGGRLLPIRISFDGQDPNSAQIIGLTGELFASGFDFDGVHFRNNVIGVTQNSGGGQFSGYIKLLMPYYSSITVDVYGGGTCWFMLERMPITNTVLKSVGITPGMHLNTYGYGQDGQKAKYSEVTLLQTTSPTIFAGLFHFVKNDQGKNFYPLEGNYKIYYGGNVTASYESSGTEDFYGSSWYFGEGAFAADDECMANKTGDPWYEISMSRFFPLWRAPYNPNGLKFTWNVGQSGEGDPNYPTTYTRWIAWYYK